MILVLTNFFSTEEPAYPIDENGEVWEEKLFFMTHMIHLPYSGKARLFAAINQVILVICRRNYEIIGYF